MSSGSTKAKEIFTVAVEQYAPDQWPGYLDDACGDDLELRRRVDLLLAAHVGDESILDCPAVACPVVEQPPITERPGSQIGPYKLLQQLGEGGMGVVYMAEQHEPVRREVALKIIKPGMDTRQVIARFEAERQALSLMDHPNIAKVLDAGATGTGRPYFVMELVKGQPITEYCDQQKLTPRQRLELFLSVCLAIQHAHQKGIIHRDVKPSNVLVAEYDGRPVAKVIDFGVAKAVNQPLIEKTMFTGFGQVVGTLEYMSPEQAGVNQIDVDTGSDIYSLGVLLYELLTGNTPFDKQRLRSAAWDEMLRIIREEEPPKPSTRLSESKHALPAVSALRQTEPAKLTRLVRGELDWIVMKALEKDRSRRYETANGFALDVQRYLADEPVQACPPSASYRFRKFARRNRTGLMTGAVVVAAMVLGSGVSVWQALVATQAKQLAQRRLDAETEARELADQALHASQVNHRIAEEQRQLADSNAQRARVNAEQANEQQRIAVAESRRAQQNETQAKAHELLARRRFYAAQLNLAQQAWDAGDPARVLPLLESQRPRFDEEDLRGFEWYYLWNNCRRGLRFKVRALDGPVNSLAFSPDGTTIAIAGHDFCTKLCDASTGHERESFPFRGRWYEKAVAFSPQGRLLAVGNYDGAITLWDVATTKSVATLGQPRPDDSKGVLSLVFSPDGTELVAGLGGGEPTVCWDLASFAKKYVLAGPSGIVAITQDGKTLATASQLWDLTVVPPQEKHSIPSLAAATADGRLLAVCQRGEPFKGFGWHQDDVAIYDVEAGQTRTVLTGHRGQINSVAFSPDGRLVASASSDRTVVLRTSLTGEALRAFAHDSEVRCVAFSPNGQACASACADGTLWLWELGTQQESDAFVQPGPVTFVGFSLDGNTLISGGDWPTRFLDAASGVERANIPPTLATGAVSPDNRTLASVRGTDVHVWDLGERQHTTTLSDVSEGSHVVVSPDGQTLATWVRYHPSIKLWDVTTRQFHLLEGLESKPDLQSRYELPFSVTFSPDSTLLAMGSSWNTLALFDVGTGKKRFSIEQEAGWVTIDRVAFSPDGRMVAAAAHQGTVRLWNVETGHLLVSLKGHLAAIKATTFSPNGRTIATGGDDGTVKLWDVATGQELLTLQGDQGMVTSLAFAADGYTLAAGTSDGTVRLWRAAPDASARAVKMELDPDDPHSPAAASRRGQGFYAAGRTAEAIGAYQESLARLEQLVARFPEQPEYWQAKSHVDTQLGSWEAAAAALTHVIELTPHPYRAHYERGVTYNKLSQWQKVIDDLSVIIPRQPAAAHLYLDRARAWRELRQYAFALSDLAKACELQSTYLTLHERARTYHLAGQYQNAVNDYTKVIELKPDFLEAYHQRGHAFESLNEWHKAIEDFSVALQGQPAWAKLYVDRGRAELRVHLDDQAAADFARATELRPTDAMVWIARGDALAELTRWDEAAEAFGTAGRLMPTDVLVRYKLALVSLAREDLDEYRSVCADLLRTLDETSDLPAAYLAAWTSVLAADTRLEVAKIVDLAEKLLRSDPANPDYATTLGAALYRAGRVEEALDRLADADSLYKAAQAPLQSAAYGWLFQALAHQRLGNAEKARAWLNRASQNGAESNPPLGPDLVPWNRRLTLKLLRHEAGEVWQATGK